MSNAIIGLDRLEPATIEMSDRSLAETSAETSQDRTQTVALRSLSPQRDGTPTSLPNGKVTSLSKAILGSVVALITAIAVSILLFTPPGHIILGVGGVVYAFIQSHAVLASLAGKAKDAAESKVKEVVEDKAKEFAIRQMKKVKQDLKKRAVKKDGARKPGGKWKTPKSDMQKQSPRGVRKPAALMASVPPSVPQESIVLEVVTSRGLEAVVLVSTRNDPVYG